jgi:hypothetical protein
MADLLANRGDVGINGLWRDIQSGIPDALEKLGAAENCAWVFGQRAEELKFGRSQMDFLFTDENSLSATIDHESANVLSFVAVTSSIRRRATGHGTNTSDELAHAERLAQVIIRAELETDNTIDFVITCAHHDDGNAGRGANFAADVVAIAVREAKVEEHYIRRICSEGVLGAFVSGGDVVHFEASKAQTVG